MLSKIRNIVLSLMAIIFLASCNDDSKKKDKSFNYHDVIDKIQIKKPHTLKSQDKCNIFLVKEIDENILNVSNAKIEIFLVEFSNGCDNNSEYSQYANETLFKLLSFRYLELVQILNKKENIFRDKILNQLSNPVSDLIDINALIDKINLDKYKSDETHREILNALLKSVN